MSFHLRQHKSAHNASAQNIAPSRHECCANRVSNVALATEPPIHASFDSACTVKNQHNFGTNEGMIAARFGSLVWILLHTFAIHADQLLDIAKRQQSSVAAVEYEALIHQVLIYRKKLCDWVYGLAVVLMCATCRQRFETYLAEHTNVRTHFETLSMSCLDITIDLHNEVNMKLQQGHVDPSSFSHFRTMYQKMMPIDRDVSEEWRNVFWTVLFLLALNFPPAWNPDLARHRLVRDTYREWMLGCTFELIPSPNLNAFSSTASFSKSQSASEAIMHSFRLKLQHMLDSPFVLRCSVNANIDDAQSTPAPSYRQVLKNHNFSRSSLFHWVHSISTLMHHGHPIFGDCIATQNLLEKKYRYSNAQAPAGQQTIK